MPSRSVPEGSKFHHTLSVKLLGYALGRAGMVSDGPLIEQMTDGLAREGRFGDLVVRVVTSEQFRNQRSQSAMLPGRGVLGGGRDE